MLTMVVTGLNLDGFVLEAKAEPTADETYLGIMLTETEFETLAYGMGEKDWWSFENVFARYQTGNSTVDGVLANLKERDAFYWTAEDGVEDYNAELAADNSGYYLVIAESTGTTAQAVTELDGTNGVVFGADYYKEDDSVPDEEANWLPYTYGNLMVDVEAPAAFSRGYFSDITLNYAADAAVSVNQTHIEGTIKGQTSNAAAKNLYIGQDVWAYGLEGFDSEKFFVETGTDEDGNTWKNAGMQFNSAAGEEAISFGAVGCAVTAEDGTPAAAEENEDKCHVSLNVLYHDGYVPTFTGASDLGTSSEGDEVWDNTIGLSYYDSMNMDEEWIQREPSEGEQAVIFANAEAWKNSHVWYNGTENTWDYRIDADGKLFDETKAQLFTEHYAGEEAYLGDYHADGEWAPEGIAASGSVAGALQALAFDSELNPDSAYYKLHLEYKYEEDAAAAGEIIIGALEVPAGVKGLRIDANGVEVDGEFFATVGVLDSIAVKAGTQLELTGVYGSTDGSIEISGGGEVSLWNVARADTDLLLTDDGVLSVSGSTVSGKIGTSPADGTIGTLKLDGWNRVGGIDSFRTVEYSYANLDVKDNQGLVFYDITNGYDETDEMAEARGNLNITIEGEPTEDTIPQFNKPVSLGTQPDMAQNENEESYPVYIYTDKDGMSYRYAKVEDAFYLVNDEDNHFTAASEPADGEILTVLQGQEANRSDCDIQLNYVQDMNVEEWQNLEFSAGTKVLKVPAEDAATAGNIAENVHYYNSYGVEKDIDGSLFSRERDNGIHIEAYLDDPENEENTAELAFENDYVSDGYNYREEVAYTSSDELANLWLEYLAEGKGYRYLRLYTNADGETDFGDLKLPTSVLGLGIYTETESATLKQASIDSITATADGQVVKIKGAYSKGFDFRKGDSNAVLQLTGARVNGAVTAEDAEVTASQETVVSSLQNMKTLNLEGNLTVENTLGFAADGQLNVTKENTDGRLLAKAGASIELPNVNCIYSTDDNLGNRLEIYEEIKDGKRPSVSVTGQIDTGTFWAYHVLNLSYGEGEDAQWRDILCHLYYYETADGEWIVDLVELNGTIYQINWDTESEEGISEIELDGITWNIQNAKLIDKSGEYTLADLKQSACDNEVSLIPYDYSKAEAAGGELLADMYTADNYNINVWPDWHSTYDAAEEVQEYYLADGAATDNNFRQIGVSYGGYQGEEFIGGCIYVYPVQKYLLTKEEEDTTFTEEDAYEDIGLHRRYAVYSVNYAEGDNAIGTSSHYIAATIPGLGAVDLADADKISVQTKQYTYTGSAIEEKPVVTCISHEGATPYVLKEGTDYTLSYSNNTNAGTAEITITAVEGSGFTGSTKATFTIARKALDKSMAAAIADQTYAGAALTPAVAVKDGTRTLVKDTDYTVSYQNNTNAGTAAVTITAKADGNYSGSISMNFTIAAKLAATLTVKGITTQYYTGKAIKPAITVYDGNVKLTGNDYTVSYSKNTNIGKNAVIKITGKGNYTGTITKNFTITVKKNASYAVGSYKYKITNAATNGKGTVAVTGPAKTSIKTIKITDTVTIGGVKFKITSIEKNAFKNCKKATSVTMGKNVTSIGANAFYNCTALTKVTIGKAVTKIGQSAFQKDKKLKTITISSSGLKSVGKNALKGISTKAAIKVPSKKLKAYQKLLKGKGQAASVKIKK